MAEFSMKDFCFPLFAFNKEHSPRYLGNSFPITPDGGLLTCRHVLKDGLREGEWLAVIDLAANKPVMANEYRVPKTSDWDITFLPKASGRTGSGYFPILPAKHVGLGSRLSTFGFFSIGGTVAQLEHASFSGTVASIHNKADGSAVMTLPFPVLEGLSGSPLFTFHSGTKLMGLAFGNRETRILKSEVLEFEDDGGRVRETINRVVEFGLAYHPATLISALEEMEVEGYIVSDERQDIPGLPK